MVWAIAVILDWDRSTYRTDIGTITGTYTDENINFTFSERNSLDMAGLNAFLAHAKAAYLQQKAKETLEASLSAQATTLVNQV